MAGAHKDLLKINDKYLTDEFSQQVVNCLKGDHPDSSPFPHFALDNFLECEGTAKVLSPLRDELDRLGWTDRSTDLYDVHQTQDLKAVVDHRKFPTICAFRKFAEGEIRDWLQNVTGTSLTAEVSLNGSKYCHTNALLPHDDRLEGRAFAFIFYLTPEWRHDYGGALQLYRADAENRPREVARRILPAANTFLFFRVQRDSWHAVEEVIAEGRERLSINGWFYSQDAVLPPPPLPEPSPTRFRPFAENSKKEQNFWINADYLSPKNMANIQRLFSQQTEISLSKFLKTDKYAAVLEELSSLEDAFQKVGSVERRNVFRLCESSLGDKHELRRLLRFLRSVSFFSLLSAWTSVQVSRPDLSSADASPPGNKKRRTEKLEEENVGAHTSSVNNSENNNDVVEFEWNLSRFSRGCYTLADDESIRKARQNGFSVEILLFFCPEVEEWPEEFGGFTTFFVDGEADELLRIPPAANTMALVFRRPDASSFTKYVNCKAGEHRFFVFSASIFRLDDGEDEESSGESGQSSDESGNGDE